MSYSQVETTLQTVLAGVTEMTTSLVTLGDDSVLDKGITQAAIIEPGGFEAEPMEGFRTFHTYQARVTIFVRFTTRAATHAAFVTLRDNVIARLRSTMPDIGNPAVSNPYNMWLETIVSDGTPQDIIMQNSPNTGPVFRAQTLVVTVKQNVTI